MLLDSRKIAAGSVHRADVCIVGAGAAGIALARELAGSGRFAGKRVALLESGGLEETDERHDLFRGVFDGAVDKEDYLTDSRCRIFGGTTHRWTGTCRPLDPIDFEHRSWVPESGWPFGLEELEPYYRRAAALVEIPPFEEYGENGQSFGFNFTQQGSRPRLVPKLLYRSTPPTRFGERYRKELADSEIVQVYLWANVLSLQARREHASVAAARVAAEPGKVFEVQAETFVLAAGGFETVRLLLSSNDVYSAGLGNGQDLVGRYYMDHTRLRRVGVWLATDRRYLEGQAYRESLAELPRKHNPYTIFTPSAEVQRQEEMLNCGVHLRTVLTEERLLGDDALFADVARLATELDHEALGAGLEVQPAPPGKRQFRVLKFYNEHVPFRESRVRLDDEADPFGQRRLRVEWRSNPQMDAAVRRTVELFARELGRAGRGRVRITFEGEPPYFEQGFLGSHHMGTTRMHPDPRHGVVDADCRVHGVQNLYVASSSVFPTGGFANPTFTILALTLRLADHLGRGAP